MTNENTTFENEELESTGIVNEVENTEEYEDTTSAKSNFGLKAAIGFVTGLGIGAGVYAYKKLKIADKINARRIRKLEKSGYLVRLENEPEIIEVDSEDITDTEE